MIQAAIYILLLNVGIYIIKVRANAVTRVQVIFELSVGLNKFTLILESTHITALLSLCIFELVLTNMNSSLRSEDLDSEAYISFQDHVFYE